MTVAPLTATVLADADEHNAGIASGVNNAIARVAGLLAIAALGAVVAAPFGASIDERLAGRPLPPGAQRVVARGASSARWRAPSPTACPPAEARVVTQAAEDASVSAFHLGVGIAAALVALGGLLGVAGSSTRAARCPARAAPAASSRGPRSRPRARDGRCPRRRTRPQHEAHRAQMASRGPGSAPPRTLLACRVRPRMSL